MRAWIAIGLASTLAAAPALAHAGDWSGCTLGPNNLNRCAVSGAPAAILAAIAAPVLVAGAAATVAHELHRRTVERQPTGAATPAATKPQRTPKLALVPPPVDRYRAAADDGRRAAPDGAVRFNETATDVGMAVGGAMVLGAIIANVAKKK